MRKKDPVKRALSLDKYPTRLRLDQVADFLNVSPDHVARLIQRKALPALVISAPGAGKLLYRVEKTALAAFIEERKA